MQLRGFFQVSRCHARKLRAGRSGSAAFGGGFLCVGATGTGRSATSPGFGATCSGFFTSSGAFACFTAADGERGSGDQTGNTKARQDLL